MTKLVDLPLSSTFAGCVYLSADGEFTTGARHPNGITDRIQIEDSCAKLCLNINDAETNAGLRTELQFGTFAAGTGEYWTTFEFKYDWDYLGGIVIGSWFASADGGDGIKYVPIGFRIRNKCLVIQVPDNLPTEGLGNKVIAAVPIEQNRWYKVTCHANLQSTAIGFREILLDGTPIVREFGVVTNYVDVVGPYFKLGPYDGFGELGFTEELTMWLRNITMWSGNDGYQTVMGSVPKARPNLLAI